MIGEAKGILMMMPKHKIMGVLGALLLTALATGCAELEKEKLPTVITAGAHQVLLGQTLQITATTQHAKDTGYTFTSSNPAIAAVSPTGVVAGVSLGETIITITGVPSGAIGRHPVVVVLSGPDAMQGDGGVDAQGSGDAGDITRQVPYFEKWLNSPHADPTAQAFTNWNREGAVPVACARCHS